MDMEALIEAGALARKIALDVAEIRRSVEALHQTRIDESNAAEAFARHREELAEKHAARVVALLEELVSLAAYSAPARSAQRRTSGGLPDDLQAPEWEPTPAGISASSRPPRELEPAPEPARPPRTTPGHPDSEEPPA